MTIAIHDSNSRWRTFLEDAKEDEIIAILARQLTNPVMEISFHELESFDPDFAESIIEHPETILKSGSHILREICQERGESIFVDIRLIELPRDRRVALRDVGRDQIGMLCSTEAVITKISEIKPRIHLAKFKCESCDFIQEIEQNNERELKIPVVCPQAIGGCGSSTKSEGVRFELQMDQSRLVNNQWMEIQELPEQVPSGAQPGRGLLLIEGDQVNKHLPGERVTANVIPTVRSEVKKGKKTPLFDIIYQLVSSEQESTPFNEISIDDEDIETILSISKREDLLTLMRDSIAPGIFSVGQIPLVKRSLALQLFGGVARINPDRTRLRGDIHILIMGDPGVAKSQLLQYMSKISPRGKLASGGGVSGAGLTAAAVKDAFSDGRFALEAGILPLSDRGLAAVDEFDKISTDDRKTMHPAMEQQQIYVAKGGITATLPARCSVLAAANPKKGRFSTQSSRTRSIMKHYKETDLPDALASRFDIIWMLQDEARVEDDERIAKHILSTRAKAVSEALIEEGQQLSPSLEQEEMVIARGVDNKEYLTIPFLRKYIAYAKRNIHPNLDDQASTKIWEYYRDARLSSATDDRNMMNRDDNINDEKVISVTARAVESLIRLTEAHSRMHLRQTATSEDADMAIAIYKHWRNEANILDEAEMHSNVSTRNRRDRGAVRGIIRNLCSESPNGITPLIDIYNDAAKMNITEEFVNDVLEKMTISGELYCPGLDKYSFVR